MQITIKDITREQSTEIINALNDEYVFIVGCGPEVDLGIVNVASVASLADDELVITLTDSRQIHLNYSDYYKIEIL